MFVSSLMATLAKEWAMSCSHVAVLVEIRLPQEHLVGFGAGRSNVILWA